MILILCSYQAYISATILLHAIAKKMLSGSLASQWQDDLTAANMCMRVLRYCSTADTVASQLSEVVAVYYTELAKLTPDNVEPNSLLGERSSAAELCYLIRPLHGQSKLDRIARDLMELMCRPFDENVGSADGPGHAKLNTDEKLRRLTRIEELYLGGQMDLPPDVVCSLDSNEQKNYLTVLVRLGAFREIRDSHFIGERIPYGWSTV